MKITFLQDDFPPDSFGGAGISTFELAYGIKERGHDVSVITTVRTGQEAGVTEYLGLKVYKVKSSYPGRWRSYVSLRNRQTVGEVKQILGVIRPDVVHINNVHTHLSYHAFKLAKDVGARVIFTARDAMAFSFAGKVGTDRYLEHKDAHITWWDNLMYARKRWNPFRNIIIKHYLKYADVLCSVSQELARAFDENGIKNVRPVHTGVRVKPNVSATNFKEKYGLLDKKIVLFGGRLGESKGGRKSIEALQAIQAVIPEVVLIVLGKEDWYAKIMHDEARKLKVEGSLVFTGWIDGDELLSAYSAADLVWVPSIYLDPLPRVVLEAMALGKPVIGSKFGGTPEMIEDGKSGYIVNPLNSTEIAAKTLEILDDFEKLHTIGRNAQDRIKNEFSLDKMVSEYISIYGEV